MLDSALAMDMNCTMDFRPSFPRSRERVRELSELAGELDLGNELGSRLMVQLLVD
jgi:hypothetical protein